MTNEALRRELTEWIVRLDDTETLEFIKLIKESKAAERKWWRNDLHNNEAPLRDEVFAEEMEKLDMELKDSLTVKVN